MEREQLVEELTERGLIAQTGGGELAEILAEGKAVYLGVDPSADSMHVGNMVPLILLKHLVDAGMTPTLLVGGGTGLIGDPKESGERPMIDTTQAAQNAEAIRTQFAALLAIPNLHLVNNLDWLQDVGLLSFLRDVGKHFTVNQLIKRDIIKRRLETDEDSISYTEFSYSLLQAYDYWHLFTNHGVNVQVGGSDQWANIISGVDLIRRKEQATTYAITTPIVIDRNTGKKFGKSEGNAVWLDPTKTTPFHFYQFWLNVSDENVAEYLRIFTFIPLDEITDLLSKHNAQPHERHAQRALAEAVTTFVHGQAVAADVKVVSQLLFAKDVQLESLSQPQIQLLQSVVPTAVYTTQQLRDEFSLVDVLLTTGLASSKNEARRFVESGAVTINGEKISADTDLETLLINSALFLIRRGKSLALLTTTPK